jgi:hypothetical protein
MARVLLASLFVLSLASSAFAQEADWSTWRWKVSAALDAQRSGEPSTTEAQSEFIQRYERYSFSGQPDASR